MAKKASTSERGMHVSITLPETNSEFAPENGWLEIQVSGMAHFQWRTVSFREATFFKISAGYSCYPADLELIILILRTSGSSSMYDALFLDSSFHR